MARILFFVIHFFLCYIAFGQVTNVKLPLPRIETKNLESTIFQNGQSLNVIKQSSIDFEFQWANNIEKPSVLITNSNEYLYNIIAIKDVRNICPSNFRVISKTDLSFLMSKAYPFGKYLEQSYSEQLFLYSSSTIQPKESCTKGEEISYEVFESLDSHVAIIDNECSSCYLKADGKIKGIMIPTIYYYPYTNNKINRGYLSDNSGVPVRCIEQINYDNYFKDNILSYRNLRPENLSRAIDSMQRYLEFQPKVKQSINVKILVGFNSSGKCDVSLISPNSYSEISNVSRILKTQLEKPYYNSISIKTRDTIFFSILPNPKSTEKKKLRDSILSPAFKAYVNDKPLKSILDECIKLNANAKYKNPNNKLAFNNLVQSNYSFPSLERVICPGPLNAFYFVLPGLGISHFSTVKGDRNNKRSKFLLGSSICIGSLAIAGKITSIYYYNSYISDLSGSMADRNYEIANISQKVFLIGSALYSGLALVDFTWTFSLGVKSKHYQHEANKKLRLMHKQNLWL